VTYINDSKATNADATARALACYNDIYWIVGGRPKEGGLDGLDSYMSRIRHAFVIGEAMDDFSAWLEARDVAVTRARVLDEATLHAHRLAQSDGGGVVLLSPACASLDQFENFEKRGDRFVEIVNFLKERPE
jgi:UDP-N-acetylmuramoylalanine--D-glutamate ligase